MSQRNWFVHNNNETFGPLTDSLVGLMLKQNRLQFTDFIWSEGLKKWTRVFEIETFARFLPPPPEVPLPNLNSEKTEEVSEPEPELVVRAAKPAANKIAAQTSPQRTQSLDGKEPFFEKNAATPVPSKVKPGIRRHDRIPMDAVIHLSNGDRYKVINMSESGALIKLGKDTSVIGTEIKFSLELKEFNKTLEMTGVVIREDQDGGTGVAVEFTRINPAHGRILKSCLETKSSE